MWVEGVWGAWPLWLLRTGAEGELQPQAVSSLAQQGCGWVRRPSLRTRACEGTSGP